MFKYAIQFANTANSLPNLDFDNRYVATTNFQGIFGICMTHKSLLSTKASDLYTWHILSLYFKFLLCTNLMTNLEFPIEFAAIAYEFLYLNITIALQMHLWNVQIGRRLPCDYLSTDIGISATRGSVSGNAWQKCVSQMRNAAHLARGAEVFWAAICARLRRGRK